MTLQKRNQVLVMKLTWLLRSGPCLPVHRVCASLHTHHIYTHPHVHTYPHVYIYMPTYTHTQYIHTPTYNLHICTSTLTYKNTLRYIYPQISRFIIIMIQPLTNCQVLILSLCLINVPFGVPKKS